MLLPFWLLSNYCQLKFDPGLKALLSELLLEDRSWEPWEAGSALDVCEERSRVLVNKILLSSQRFFLSCGSQSEVFLSSKINHMTHEIQCSELESQLSFNLLTFPEWWILLPVSSVQKSPTHSLTLKFFSYKMGIKELFHKVGITVKNNTEKFLAHTVAKQMIALKRLDSK